MKALSVKHEMLRKGIENATALVDGREKTYERNVLMSERGVIANETKTNKNEMGKGAKEIESEESPDNIVCLVVKKGFFNREKMTTEANQQKRKNCGKSE